MMVLITYDVETSSPSGQKRLRKVAKACVDYGTRVQNSVFECVLDPSQLLILKRRLQDIIDEDNDSIRFYFLGNHWKDHVETIGKTKGFDVTGSLIL